MATALQQQLAAIAANSTHQLDLKAQKTQHSKSLLFERRDAASQSFETIFQLCREGFEELCQLDARFIPFGSNLFSEQSKSEDRTMMTAQENAALDSVIISFLGLLGGRLLLKPAMKAAEWLVRRFKVHEYNTDAILFTFLPYHATHVFPTLLSILPEQLPPDFRFLHPYVSSLQSPPRNALVAAAAGNPAFFAAFSRHVTDLGKARHHSTFLLGFWASVTAQAVNAMIDASRSGRESVRRQKEEDLLLKILPTLQDTFSARGVPELYLGSCMITTILVTKVSLNDKVLSALIDVVAEGWDEQTAEDGLTCLAVLAEEKGFGLPQRALRAIFKQTDSVKLLSRISTKCRTDRLLTGIALGAVDAASRQRDMRPLQLLETLQGYDLPREAHLRILRSVLQVLQEMEKQDDIYQELSRALSTLGSQHPHLFTLAAKDSGIDSLALEAGILAPAESDEDDMRGEDEADFKESDELMISSRRLADFDALPNLQPAHPSFLDHANNQIFSDYVAAFQRVFQTKQELKAFLELPSLQQSASLTQPCMLTFCARVWTSDLPFHSRLQALRMFCNIVRRAQKEEKLTDLQALIPYAVAALGDPHKAIRSSAANVLSAISEVYESKPAQNEPLLQVLAKDDLYGEHSLRVQWLCFEDARKLVSDRLMPLMEDCVLDEDYIYRALPDIINAKSRSGPKELKAALRGDTYAFLISHAVASPVQALKLRLLHALSRVGKAAGSSRSQILLPYIKRYVQEIKDRKLPSDAVSLMQALLGCVTHRSADELNLLKDLASDENALDASLSGLAFGRIRQIWPAISTSGQADLVDWFLTLSVTLNTSDEIRPRAMEVLRNLALPSEILVHLVEALPSVADLQDPGTPAKRQRTGRIYETPRTGDIDKQKLNNAIRRITIVLELVEQSNPEKHPQLLKGLFHFLTELHHYKTLMNSELVFLQEILISSLLCVVNGLKGSPSNEVDRSVIRADLVVDMVRTTSNIQVHQASLLLMSALASWAPDLVLHSVMPLFTFMSSTILKQGDEYSAHVTDQTVARIIPPLAVSLKKRGKDLISGAAELLLSFTAAFEHIPLHRRLGLFQHLVQTLGPAESLFAIAAMLVERYADDPGVRSFVPSLMAKFPVAVQLQAIQQYLDLVFDTLKPRRSLSDVILGFGEKDAKDAMIATSALLDGVADILRSAALRKTLAKELKSGGDQPEMLRVKYSVVMEKTMQLDLQLRSHEEIYQSASNVLDALLDLMPTSDFIDSSAKLMQSGTDEIRQQVFRSLEHRVDSARSQDKGLQQVFMEVLPNCTVFLTRSQPVATRHAAITCIDRISEKFGKTDRSVVMQTAEQIMGDAGLRSDDHALRRMSILCLASMVEVLEDEFIPLLPRTLDAVTTDSMLTLEDDETDNDLVAAGFGLATAILDHIPWVLSGTMLQALLRLVAKAHDEKAERCGQLIAKNVAAQDCLRAMDQAWDDILDCGAHGMTISVGILQAVIRHHPKATITNNVQLLFSVLLKCFDLYGLAAREPDLFENETLFDMVNSATMDAVLKLNDATFRPFFLRLSDWAFEDSRQKVTLRKTIGLYSFTRVLFEQLKSLVTNYIGLILEKSAQLLNTLSPAEDSERTLLNLVLQTISTNFAHDQDGFWQTPTHFDALATPLTAILGQASVMNTSEDLIPAITELATAASSPDQHTSLNAMLMKFMRHEDPAVRLAAVKCERSLTERLHMDWCQFIPEWLPYISELQEDDAGEVERETLRWMGQISEVTGEDLNNMLQ